MTFLSRMMISFNKKIKVVMIFKRIIEMADLHDFLLQNFFQNKKNF